MERMYMGWGIGWLGFGGSIYGRIGYLSEME